MPANALKKAKVALIGVGGLGSPIAISLVQSGVRHFKLIDRDIVSRTDLHRQILYRVNDVGRPKAEVAVERLKEMNPELDAVGIPEPITSENVENIVEDVGIVIDGLDNMRTRYMINRACVKLGRPYIFASAVEMFGNVSTVIPGRTPCLECFYGGLDDSQLPKCGVVGVHPSVLGVVANIAVSEAVKILEGDEAALAGKLLFVDLREPSFDIVGLEKNPNCPICKGEIHDLKGLEEVVEESCARDGSGTFFINRVNPVDLRKVEKRCGRYGWSVIKKDRSSITLKFSEGLEGTLMSSGSMVFKVGRAVPSIEKLKQELLDIHERLVGQKGGAGDGI